jgi:hypothetical protein
MIKLHLETEKQTANGLKKKQIDYFDLLYSTVTKQILVFITTGGCAPIREHRLWVATGACLCQL